MAVGADNPRPGEPDEGRERTIGAFFEDLGRRGHDPRVARLSGSTRFEVVGDDDHSQSWVVAVDKGRVTVSGDGGTATCVMRASRESYDRLAQGRLNLMAAALSGEITIEGDPRVLVLFQRLFPRPSDTPAGRATARAAT
jgi:hypothetical protein